MFTEKKSFLPSLLLVVVVIAVGAGIGWRANSLSEALTALEMRRDSIANVPQPSFLENNYDPVLDARRSRLDNEIYDAQRKSDDWLMGFIVYASVALAIALLRIIAVPILRRSYQSMMERHDARRDEPSELYELGRSVKSGLTAAAITINKAIPRQPTTGLGRLSTADELRKWSDLRDEGLVTEEEFQKMRDKLVG